MRPAEPGDLRPYLRRVRSRWQRVRLLRAWTASGLAAGVVVIMALAIHVALRPGAVASAWLWSASLVASVGCAASLLRLLRGRPSDLQVARLIEERCPELEDTLATAVAAGDHAQTPMTHVVIADAVRRLQGLPLDCVIPSQILMRIAVAAVSVTLLVLVSWGLAVAPAARGVRLSAFYLMPGHFGLVVRPGDVRVPAGRPLELLVQLPVVAEGAVPSVRIDGGERGGELPMQPKGRGFALAIAQVDRTFRYIVTAAGVSSPEYTVTAIFAPRVERVDLRYQYPPAFKLEPRDEPNGGDIFGPAGTRVHLSIQADKTVTAGELTLAGGTRVPLIAAGDRLEGELTIAQDTSYRIAMSDADGLTSAGDVEYFVRTLEDRPPDVRIVQPASDRRATPLEEVSIEARADDDFGVTSFDLVYAVRGQAERVVPFVRGAQGLSVTGRRTIYLEDLDVQPGDFVTYYARATDVSRGKQSTEARSDMFFLEVAPFDEEFVVSDAQGGGGGDQAITDMIAAQKQIITATWTLDRRMRDTGGRPEADIRAVAQLQGDLRRRALSAAAQAQRAADVRRRRNGVRPPAGPVPLDDGDDAVGRAADAMLSAERQLEALKTAPAVRFEMAALNELMRADAGVRRREIERQQTAGNAAGENRQQQDLSSLFDKELARQQQTNYETQRATTETRSGTGQSSSALDKVRDLATRQEALNREQETGNGTSRSEAERRRQLERLTREQLNLKQQTDDLAREIGRQGSRTTGAAEGALAPAGRGDDQQRRQSLEQTAQDMQAAANELRRQDRGDAQARGEQALARLRDLEQQLSGSSAQGRQRQLGDLQMEARQLADAQRALTGQRTRQSEGPRAQGPQANRTVGAGEEQRRLADRADRLQQGVQRLAEQAREVDTAGGAPLAEAAQELARAGLGQQMRDGVDRSEAEGIAQALERVSERLGAAVAGESEEARRLSEELARLSDLRERLDAADRKIAESSKAGPQPQDRPTQSPQNAQMEAGAEPWEAARQLLEDVRREKALGVSPEGGRFNPGRSAPGTEAWKQDVARWDELKVQLRAALEKAESSTAIRLRGQRARDRLNAGATQSVPESFRGLVERYYRALAGDRRP